MRGLVIVVLSLLALRSDAAFGDVYEPADELEVEADFEDFEDFL